jgi:hypothetical protein
MMTATVHSQPAPDLDAEYRAAIARLDADLQIVVRSSRHASADTRNMLGLLRQRVVAAYRTALVYAAGRPDDITWQSLGATTAVFLARVPYTAITGQAHRAVVRLAVLASENI